jgi:hypothetical protein
VALSKRSVAKEWLIFIALFPIGSVSCFFLGYYSQGFRDSYFSRSFLRTHSPPFLSDSGDHWLGGASPFDRFWNDAFGLANVETLLLWLVPYFIVTLLRSIAWSIRTLRRG